MTLYVPAGRALDAIITNSALRLRICSAAVFQRPPGQVNRTSDIGGKPHDGAIDLEHSPTRIGIFIAEFACRRMKGVCERKICAQKLLEEGYRVESQGRSMRE